MRKLQAARNQKLAAAHAQQREQWQQMKHAENARRKEQELKLAEQAALRAKEGQERLLQEQLASQTAANQMQLRLDSLSDEGNVPIRFDPPLSYPLGHNLNTTPNDEICRMGANVESAVQRMHEDESFVPMYEKFYKETALVQYEVDRVHASRIFLRLVTSQHPVVAGFDLKISLEDGALVFVKDSYLIGNDYA